MEHKKNELVTLEVIDTLNTQPVIHKSEQGTDYLDERINVEVSAAMYAEHRILEREENKQNIIDLSTSILFGLGVAFILGLVCILGFSILAGFATSVSSFVAGMQTSMFEAGKSFGAVLKNILMVVGCFAFIVFIFLLLFNNEDEENKEYVDSNINENSNINVIINSNNTL